MTTTTSTSLTWTDLGLAPDALSLNPLLNLAWLLPLLALIIFLLIWVPLHRRARLARVAFLVLLTGFALGPMLAQNHWTPTPRVVAIITDRSASANLNDRTAQIDRALTHLRAQFDQHRDVLTPVYLDLTSGSTGRSDVLPLLAQAFADIPRDRRGGAIIIGDGQFHDLITPLNPANSFGPLHFLRAGRDREYDQHLTLDQAPSYAIVGEGASLRVRVAREGTMPDPTLPAIRVRRGAETIATTQPDARTGLATIRLPIDRAGDNAFLLDIPTQEGEVTGRNNHLGVVIRGVRDRLKVLLVSAEPSIGGRMLRNLLTSDPGIDLVHFTILRHATSIDPTPSDQMALIPFPFDELFNRKLNDFDLVVLDRYRANMIMSNRYLDNIARYVRQGGALLDITGAAAAGENSIFSTTLADVLPLRPTGRIDTTPFRPDLTETGRAHPITAPLGGGQKNWAPWSIRIDTTPAPTASLLLRGPNNTPLLAVTRVDQGRAGQLASDQIWLWARGARHAGPYVPLMRPLIHWLLKEPTLEEERIETQTTAEGVEVRLHTLDPRPDAPPLALIDADGATQTVPLTRMDNGPWTARLKDLADGLYTLRAPRAEATLVVGAPDAPEWQNVTATDQLMATNLTRPSGGAIVHLADHPMPNLHFGSSWSAALSTGGNIPFPADPARTLRDRQLHPLLPDGAWLGMLLILLLLMWGLERQPRGKTPAQD